MSSPPIIAPVVVAAGSTLAAPLARALGGEVRRLEIDGLPLGGDDPGAWKPWVDELDGRIAGLALERGLPAMVLHVGPPTGGVGGQGQALSELGLHRWCREVEQRLAAWYGIVAAAARAVADDGALVLVISRPAPLDVGGWAPATALADAATNLVRSFARSEGPRGVRVNGVGWGAEHVPERLVGPAPALAGYPGRVEVELAGAVRLLVDRGAVGITGQVVEADSGRAIG